MLPTSKLSASSFTYAQDHFTVISFLCMLQLRLSDTSLEYRFSHQVAVSPSRSQRPLAATTYIPSSLISRLLHGPSSSFASNRTALSSLHLISQSSGSPSFFPAMPPVTLGPANLMAVLASYLSLPWYAHYAKQNHVTLSIRNRGRRGRNNEEDEEGRMLMTLA